MDALDLVADAGRDLLARVDEVLLAAGAPAGHRVWPLLRRAGALPGDALAGVAALDPGALGSAAARLRGTAAGYEAGAGLLAGPVDWGGPAAAVATARRGDLLHRVGPDGAAGRLRRCADHLDEVAGWAAAGRRTVAGAVASALVSAEAVRLRAGREPGVLALAAADVAAAVLTAVVDVVERGAVLAAGPPEPVAGPPRSGAGGADAGGDVLRARL